MIYRRTRRGDSADHARRSALRAEELLTDAGVFSAEEVSAVTEAISVHGAKGQRHGVLAELLKDADVLQHYLYNPSLGADWKRDARLQAILAGLSQSQRQMPDAPA